MSQLDQIVSVSITADSKTPSRLGFGTPLLLSYHTRFADRYRKYTALSEMTADGFTVYDDAYRMAAAVFAQDPTATEVVVGRLPAAPAFTQRLTVKASGAVEGAVVSCVVVEPATGTHKTVSRTTLAAETTTDVATALEGLLIVAVAGVDSTATGPDIDVTPTVAGRKVHIYGLQHLDLEETTADANYDDELPLLQLENDDWYFVTIDSSSNANINAVAAWVGAQKKLFFAATNSSDELDGTGTLGSGLVTNARTALLWAERSHEFAACAYAAKFAASDPGSITGAHKTLNSVTVKGLDATSRSNLETDNISHYQTIRSIPVVYPAKLTNGEWIDIQHGIDALEARIQEDVFALLANSQKVPFNDVGLDLVRSTILAAMRQFEAVGQQPALLNEGSSDVIMPLLSAIPSTDKAARQLKGVRFSATLSGAVHSLTIVGTLSY